ncbi:MAG: prephenate dehydratase [Alphaproteobacteria bacterium]|nr:MAG: prephenate dehydratase [Alphaproteobacteria bacterium]
MVQADQYIAFMGVAGANADLACRQKEPYMNTLALPAFDDVFEAVSEGRAHLGMIPIENSQAGRVAEIHNLLPHYDVHIVGEHIQRVEHHLLGIKGTNLEHVRDVYSHPQAIMQCRGYLRAHSQWSPRLHSNTAVAACDVAQWNDPTKVAIASELAAELYGLEILERNIEDAKDNVTVFVMIAREPNDPSLEDGITLTSLLFELRNIPSALYKAIGGFATNGINLVKLESYIRGGGSSESQFFVTFEGHPDSAPVKRALEELGFYSRRVRVLGVYLADPTRYQY